MNGENIKEEPKDSGDVGCLKNSSIEHDTIGTEAGSENRVTVKAEPAEDVHPSEESVSSEKYMNFGYELSCETGIETESKHRVTVKGEPAEDVHSSEESVSSEKYMNCGYVGSVKSDESCNEKQEADDENGRRASQLAEPEEAEDPEGEDYYNQRRILVDGSEDDDEILPVKPELKHESVDLGTLTLENISDGQPTCDSVIVARKPEKVVTDKGTLGVLEQVLINVIRDALNFSGKWDRTTDNITIPSGSRNHIGTKRDNKSSFKDSSTDVKRENNCIVEDGKNNDSEIVEPRPKCDLLQRDVSHRQIHDKENPHPCKGSVGCNLTEPRRKQRQCRTEVTKKTAFDEHSPSHSEKNKYRCDTCRKKFARKADIIRHVKIHAFDKPYRCKTCQKSFFRKAHFNRHLSTHSGERPHKCNICQNRFTRNAHLKRHMLIHADKKPRQCETCRQCFDDDRAFNKHISAHTIQLIYECDVCQKTFRRKSNLGDHLLCHFGERNHECEICRKSFVSKSTLKRHMLVHSGERPHHCNVCQKKFIRKSDLKKHMLTHTGVKPHICYICEKAFAQRATLNNHIEVIHVQGKPYRKHF